MYPHLLCPAVGNPESVDNVQEKAAIPVVQRPVTPEEKPFGLGAKRSLESSVKFDEGIHKLFPFVVEGHL
ncbi:hypothetical protein AX14_005874 [Amanita brunnescens Koide BX004]|nr:hypothetical protein AX14_005874 [Amanita brunnescens Koide BX004]